MTPRSRWMAIREVAGLRRLQERLARSELRVADDAVRDAQEILQRDQASLASDMAEWMTALESRHLDVTALRHWQQRGEDGRRRMEGAANDLEAARAQAARAYRHWQDAMRLQDAVDRVSQRLGKTLARRREERSLAIVEDALRARRPCRDPG